VFLPSEAKKEWVVVKTNTVEERSQIVVEKIDCQIKQTAGNQAFQWKMVVVH
jgi:hypothetical protein